MEIYIFVFMLQKKFKLDQKYSLIMVIILKILNGLKVQKKNNFSKKNLQLLN